MILPPSIKSILTITDLRGMILHLKKLGIITMLDQQKFDYDSINSTLDIPGLDDGYYLIRNGNDYSFLQKVNHDIYFSGSTDEKSFYVYDFDEKKFTDFEINYLGNEYSSNNKIHSVDISNLAYTNEMPFVINVGGEIF